MRLIITVLALAALSGCVTMPTGGGWLTHHVTVSIDDKRCMSASRWGVVTIGGDINDSECTAIVDGRRARDVLRLMGYVEPKR